MSSILFRFSVPALLVVLGLGVEPATAQPSIVSRTLVSMGDYNYPVNETSVAAYGDKLVAMWNVMKWNGSNFPHHRLGYAVSEDGGESWTDMGFFPQPSGCSDGEILDPTVAADPLGESAGDFIGGGLIFCTQRRAHVATMPSSETEFDDALALTNNSNCRSDYTQLAIGPDPSDPEESTNYYMTCFVLPEGPTCDRAIGLHRSVDGGQTWSTRSLVEVNSSILAPISTPWPVVASDGTLYIAYHNVSNQNAVVTNVIANASAGSGQFVSLGLNHSRIPFQFPSSAMYGNYVPGAFRVLNAIQMAADPTDPNVLYIVYHDFVTAPEQQEDDGDVDVYLIRGEYNGQSEEWEWSSRIRVNNDSAGVEQDQFYPTIVVDGVGDLHIAWFDTRNDPQGPDDDVLISLFYAHSDDGGETFTNHEIDEVAIDTLVLQQNDFIGDYIRITMADDAVVIV